MKPNQNDIASGIRAMLDKCAALEAENARLRGVIQRVLDGNYPRAGLHATGTAGVQECQHLVTVGPFSHCHSCMRNFLAEAMADQWGEAA
jgi:hypothetical protein